MATTIQPKDIAILRRQMRETKNETLKNALKKKIERLTEDLKAQETPAKDLAMALFKAKDEINAMAKSEFNPIVKRLANKPGYSFLKTMSKSEIKDDLKREAKPVGWRFRGRTNFKKPTAKDVKEKNDVYYEARRNRSDVIRPAKLAKGGGVGDENKGMVMNNNVQIMHHAKELSEAVKSAEHIPAWVVAKVYDATQTLSDVTHYLDGENKMAKGGLLKDKATYIPNRMISTLEVERNGKTIDIDPADIIDGVYVKKRVKYGEGGGVKQFDFVYEKWDKPVSGTIGTIRTKPENYWVATIKEGDIIVFDSWDGAVKDIDKSSVSKMWQSGQIPTK